MSGHYHFTSLIVFYVHSIHIIASVSIYRKQRYFMSHIKCRSVLYVHYFCLPLKFKHVSHEGLGQTFQVKVLGSGGKGGTYPLLGFHLISV